MPKSLTKKTNTAITFPRELYEHIVEFLQRDKRHGYVSASEFLKDAARRRLEELNYGRNSAVPAERSGSGQFCRKCGSELRGPFCSNCGTKN